MPSATRMTGAPRCRLGLSLAAVGPIRGCNPVVLLRLGPQAEESPPDPARPRRGDRWVERPRSIARRSSRCAGFGDPIDALTIYFLGNEIEIEFLLDYACEEAADGMLLPVGRLHDRGNRGALWFV